MITKDEALKLALEDLENCADLLKVFEAPIDSCVGATMLQAEKAIIAIKQALAAPVQEPVAWVQRATEWLLDLPKTPLDYPYFTNGMFKNDCHSLAEALQGYTPPAAQRQWVGLTGQQKNLIARISVDVFDAIHRTEAKLKEKNA